MPFGGQQDIGNVKKVDFANSNNEPFEREDDEE